MERNKVLHIIFVETVASHRQH